MNIKNIAIQITGTGFEGRDKIISRFCKKDLDVKLKREPNNKYDKNAISVWLWCSSWFRFIARWRKIGYIKASRAAELAVKIDNGDIKILSAWVNSFFIHDYNHHHRVSIVVELQSIK